MIAIFIDGPIAGETLTVQYPLVDYRVPIPAVTTICYCDNDIGDEYIQEPREYIYNRVAHGPTVVLYSKHKTDEKALVESLKLWIQTDLIHPLHYDCHDRRAWQ